MWREVLDALRRFWPKSTTGNPRVSIAEDEVGLLKPADLSFDAGGNLNVNVNNLAAWPKSAAGNPRVSIAEDEAGLAKEATLSGLRTTVDTYLPNLDITVSSLRDALKPSRGAVTQDLAAASVAAGGYQDVDKSGLDGWSALAVTVKVTYDAAATAGVRVLWLYSPDGVNYDSEDDAVAQGNYVDPSFAAGATRQVTFIVPLFTPYVRIRVKNLDATYAATVDMWTVPLR